MNPRKINTIFGAVLGAAGIAIGSSPGRAQTFQSYHCSDRTQFIVGFFDHDSRAYLQLDGRAVTLARRIAVSGTRYTGSGVTLKIGKAGITLKHLKRSITACEET